MRIFSILLRMIVDPEYRRQELHTDKKSMVLLLVGLPLGCLFLFLTLYSLPTIFGEDKFYSAIEKIRPFVCSTYLALYEVDICSDTDSASSINANQYSKIDDWTNQELSTKNGSKFTVSIPKSWKSWLLSNLEKSAQIPEIQDANVIFGDTCGEGINDVMLFNYSSDDFDTFHTLMEKQLIEEGFQRTEVDQDSSTVTVYELQGNSQENGEIFQKYSNKFVALIPAPNGTMQVYGLQRCSHEFAEIFNQVTLSLEFTD